MEQLTVIVMRMLGGLCASATYTQRHYCFKRLKYTKFIAIEDSGKECDRNICYIYDSGEAKEITLLLPAAFKSFVMSSMRCRCRHIVVLNVLERMMRMIQSMQLFQSFCPCLKYDFDIFGFSSFLETFKYRIGKNVYECINILSPSFSF